METAVTGVTGRLAPAGIEPVSTHAALPGSSVRGQIATPDRHRKLNPCLSGRSQHTHTMRPSRWARCFRE